VGLQPCFFCNFSFVVVHAPTKYTVYRPQRPRPFKSAVLSSKNARSLFRRIVPMSDAVETVFSADPHTQFKENTSKPIQCGVQAAELLGESNQSLSVAVKADLNHLGNLGAEHGSRDPKISQNSSKQQSMLSVAGRGRVMDGRTFVLDGHVPWQSESLDPRGQPGQWLPWNSAHKVEGSSFAADSPQRAGDKKPAGSKRQRQENSAFPYQSSFCAFAPPYSSITSSLAVKGHCDESEASKSNKKPSNNRIHSEKDAAFGEFNLQSCENDSKATDNSINGTNPAFQSSTTHRSTNSNPPRFKVGTDNSSLA
jgi:hypothetical protein